MKGLPFERDGGPKYGFVMTRFAVALGLLSGGAAWLGRGELRWAGLAGLTVAGVVAAWLVRRALSRRMGRRQLEGLRALAPAAFEAEVAGWFRRAGWNVEQCGGTNDGGVDLVATRKKETMVIQCKRYAEHAAVSAAQVRDLYGAAVAAGATGAIVVTTGRVSAAARKWAEDLPDGPAMAFHDMDCVTALARGRGVVHS